MHHPFMIARRQFIMTAVAVAAAPALVHANDPMVFDHAYGRTILNAPAKRVVSLGFNTQDPLLAMGVIPVAIRNWYGIYPYGVWPWAQSYLGDTQPVVLTGEASAEIIAGLKPDLIVGIGSGISPEEYAVLSQIAPVLMQPVGTSTWGASWQDITRTLGRAIGKPEQADALISATNARFTAARDAHPEWAGKTAVAAWNDGSQTGAFMGQDTRARFLNELGFVCPAPLRDIQATDGFYTTFSPEDLSPIDADLLIWISSLARAADIANLPMRQTMRAVHEGREVFTDELTAGALSFGTVLSLPYALDLLEPEIAAAMDGNPETVVPSAQKAGLVK